jgi:putative transposase
LLTQAEVLQLCQRLGLSPQAQALIETIRSSPPSRHVRSAAGNVSVRYPSRKMGVTIQAESHRNELAGVYEKEHDLHTLEYYDQPPPIQLQYQTKRGQRVSVRHTPDYFVIGTEAVGWEEWKTEAALRQLVEEKPFRFVRDPDGRWRCPPGEQYAEPLGFFYRVRCSSEIDWVFQRNLLFLEDYLRADCAPVAQPTLTAVHALLAAQPGISLAELLRQTDVASSDELNTLIAQEQVYVAVRAAPLAEPERVRVFRDEETARAYAVLSERLSHPMTDGPRLIALTAGTAIAWDNRHWTLINAGQTSIALLAEDGALVELPNATFEALLTQGKLSALAESVTENSNPTARERLACASPDDFREANRRYAIIAPRLAGQLLGAETTPARTMRHWLAHWRGAERAYGCGYVGLLPRRAQSGNHQRKLPARTLALMDEFIANDYETLKQKPKVEVYGALLRACEAQGTAAPSYKTFAAAVNARPRQAQVEARQGRRAAYQQSPFCWELTPTTPRHGDRPFEIGHIDHTELDVELVCSRTGRNLGRPWATFLSDAFSRRILAVYLSFDPPSYRACMMVLRECVRRYARLPQVVVVDGGREFESTYFETLLARYECTKKTRPAAQARFGSVCERLFGTTNTRFVHNLMGNTQVMRNVREVTKAVDPKGQACWTLGELYTRLCEWAYAVYETLDHPALGQSPRDAFAAGLVQSGGRPQRRIAYDEDFRMCTLPTTDRGTAKVQPRLGVKIHYIHYWSDAFLDPQVERCDVPVRFDPFDAGSAYAFVKGHWVRCISEHYARFAGRSERELLQASAELRRRHQRHRQRLALTARQLADFLASVEAEEVLLEQRLRDAELKAVLGMSERGRDEVSRAETPGAPETEAQASRLPMEADAVQTAEALVIYEDYA